MNKIESVNELKNRSYVNPVTLDMFLVKPTSEVTAALDDVVVCLDTENNTLISGSMLLSRYGAK